MDASGSATWRFNSPVSVTLLWSVSLAGLASWSFVILLFAARRLTVDALQPLSPATVVGLGLSAVAAASLIRAPWWFAIRSTPSGGSLSQTYRSIGFAAPGAIALLTWLVLWLPGTPIAAAVVAGALIVGGEVGWHLWHRRVSPTVDRARADGSTAQSPQDVSPPDLPQESLTADSRLQQQLTRMLDPVRGEVATGQLRAQFLVGQRSQSVHVAFCPPLVALPSVIAEQMAGPSVTIKPADIQTYGVRFDLRLADPPRTLEEVVICFETEPAESD